MMTVNPAIWGCQLRTSPWGRSPGGKSCHHDGKSRPLWTSPSGGFFGRFPGRKPRHDDGEVRPLWT